MGWWTCGFFLDKQFKFFVFFLCCLLIFHHLGIRLVQIIKEMDSARFHCGFISSFSYSLLDRNSSKVLDLSEFEKKTGDVTFFQVSVSLVCWLEFCFPLFSET